jgi:hypothetical protein
MTSLTIGSNSDGGILHVTSESGMVRLLLEQDGWMERTTIISRPFHFTKVLSEGVESTAARLSDFEEDGFVGGVFTHMGEDVIDVSLIPRGVGHLYFRASDSRAKWMELLEVLKGLPAWIPA